jgi:hypothetical protein
VSVYARRNYNDGQILFNRALFGFIIVIKVALKIIVYSPLLLAGWLVTKQMVNLNANAILFTVLILLFAILLYFFIYFLKGVLIALKYNRNLFWLPLFIFCVALTCIFPVWVVFEPLTNIIGRYAQSNQQFLTWIFASTFGLYVYSEYYFLTNIAPTVAYPYYQRGINMAMHSLNLSDSFKAKKSLEII